MGRCAYGVLPKDAWEFYQEPQQDKKTVKMWPALFKNYDGGPSVSDVLFESLEDAFQHDASRFIFWPAKPNADGSYDVQVDGE